MSQLVGSTAAKWESRCCPSFKRGSGIVVLIFTGHRQDFSSMALKGRDVYVGEDRRVYRRCEQKDL